MTDTTIKPLTPRKLRENDMLETIAYFTLRAHKGQVDKGNNPYFLHPFAVAGNVNGFVKKAIALLHDVVEDTEVTMEDLDFYFYDILLTELCSSDLTNKESSKVTNQFREILDGVDAITRRKGESLKDYYSRIKENGKNAVYVKIEDLKNNLDPLRCASAQRAGWDGLEESSAMHGVKLRELQEWVMLDIEEKCKPQEVLEIVEEKDTTYFFYGGKKK